MDKKGLLIRERMPYRCRDCRKREQFEKLKAKLVKYMRTLDSDRLGYWAGVVMLDPRFCGATGTGAYSAVASECVNQAAPNKSYESGAY